MDDIEIRKLIQKYDVGEIDGDDLSDEEMDQMIMYYEHETDELNKDTRQRLEHIRDMLFNI